MLSAISEGQGVNSAHDAFTVSHEKDDDRTLRSGQVSLPEFSHPANANGHIVGRRDTATASWTSKGREFEEELFRTAVYLRNAARTQSVSSFSSTINTAQVSLILSYLTLADVSIVSMLRLPVQLEGLVNRSAYVSDDPRPDDQAEIETSQNNPVPQENDLTQVKSYVRNHAYDDARGIALNLHVPLSVTRDALLAAALRHFQIEDRTNQYVLLLTSDGKDILLDEHTHPLPLYSALILEGQLLELSLSNKNEEHTSMTSAFVLDEGLLAYRMSNTSGVMRSMYDRSHKEISLLCGSHGDCETSHGQERSPSPVEPEVLPEPSSPDTMFSFQPVPEIVPAAWRTYAYPRHPPTGGS